MPGASSSPLPQHPEGGMCKDDSGCPPGKAERKAQGKAGPLHTPFQPQASSSRKSFLPSPLTLACPVPEPATFLSSGFCFWVPHQWGFLRVGMGGLLCTLSFGWAPRGFSLAAGIRTGKCVAFNDTVRTCEIFGWCPVEVDDYIPR